MSWHNQWVPNYYVSKALHSTGDCSLKQCLEQALEKKTLSLATHPPTQKAGDPHEEEHPSGNSAGVRSGQYVDASGETDPAPTSGAGERKVDAYTFANII